MVFLSRDSRVGVPKSRQMGLPRLWSPITLRADLKLTCSLKQSCSSRRNVSNGMSYPPYNQVNRVDSHLFVVRSQTCSLTPGLSFGHNLCFKYSNEQYEPILNIYIPRAFQWFKERHKPLSFDPCNRSLKFWESTGTPSPKWELSWECEGSLPHTFLHSQECVMWLLGPQTCNPFALVASPKLGLRHLRIIIIIINELQNTNFIENLSMKFYPYKTTTIKNNLRPQSFPIF
jgi:hypothetical protein